MHRESVFQSIDSLHFPSSKYGLFAMCTWFIVMLWLCAAMAKDQHPWFASIMLLCVTALTYWQLRGSVLRASQTKNGLEIQTIFGRRTVQVSDYVLSDQAITHFFRMKKAWGWDILYFVGTARNGQGETVGYQQVIDYLMQDTNQPVHCDTSISHSQQDS